MSLLQNNPVGQGLAVVLGVLAVLAVVIGVAWSLPVTPIEADAPESVDTTAAGAVAAMELSALEDYSVVVERPAFNESRRPEEKMAGEPVVEAPKQNEGGKPPELRLTGVVITPDYSVAILTPRNNGDPLLVHEGERLGDDHGNWVLTDVEYREVMLSRPNGRQHNLELEVHDSAMDAPPPAERRTVVTGVAQKPPQEPGTDGAGQPPIDAAQDPGGQIAGESRADEIRRRIQERREELARQQEQEDQAQANRPTGNEYRDAIRNMMQGDRDSAGDNSKNGSSDDD